MPGVVAVALITFGIFNRLLGDGLRPLLVVSSDAGPFDCEFGRMHYSMELAVLAGLSPLQAIEAATSIAARTCGVAGLAGTVEPGKEADLLVVHGNPLDDIRRMADVAAVYKGGLRSASCRATRSCPRGGGEGAALARHQQRGVRGS